jgi:hypothetical protein
MRGTFYVVDEATLPPAFAEGSEAATPAAIIAAIRRHGGRWGQAESSIDEFAAVFETLEGFTGTPDFLRDLAFAGSPHLLLTEHPGPWRLGYFETSLVPHLHAVFNQLDAEIEPAISALGPNCAAVFAAFRSAIEEASSRGFAVAIVHE